MRFRNVLFVNVCSCIALRSGPPSGWRATSQATYQWDSLLVDEPIKLHNSSYTVFVYIINIFRFLAFVRRCCFSFLVTKLVIHLGAYGPSVIGSVSFVLQWDIYLVLIPFDVHWLPALGVTLEFTPLIQLLYIKHTMLSMYNLIFCVPSNIIKIPFIISSVKSV